MKIELVGHAELTKMMRVDRRTITNWVNRKILPKPLVQLKATPVWDKAVIKKWMKNRPK
jgi:predicted DNA-binding transcriptional regulator AlpA